MQPVKYRVVCFQHGINGIVFFSEYLKEVYDTSSPSAFFFCIVMIQLGCPDPATPNI